MPVGERGKPQNRGVAVGGPRSRLATALAGPWVLLRKRKGWQGEIG